MRHLPVIKLEDFEGPFDLLIELARNKKLDLSKVSLAKITDDFLRHLDEQSPDHELFADFMLVASTLLLIKTRQLMPELTNDEEEEIADLTDRLRIYNLYREKAISIQETWNKSSLLPAASYVKKNSNSTVEEWPLFGIEDITTCMKQVISQIPPPIYPRAHLKTRGRSLQECTDLFYTRLNRMKEFAFHDVVSGASKQDVAISFLAVLEMSRNQTITIHQETFADNLLIKKAS